MVDGISWLIEAVCFYFGITEEELLSDNQESRVSDPRHIIMYLFSTEWGLTDEAIGEILNRSRSTVWSGIVKISNLKIYNKELRLDIKILIHYLNNPKELRRKPTKISLSPKSKKIYQYDTDMRELAVYNSARQASRKTGIGIDTIYRSLRDYKKLGKGYYWIKK